MRTEALTQAIAVLTNISLVAAIKEASDCNSGLVSYTTDKRDQLDATINAIQTSIADLQAMLSYALENDKVYDQSAMELCSTCGWKARIPDEVCVNCEYEKAFFQKPVAWFHPDGRRFLGHGTKQCNRGGWVDEYCIPVYTRAPYDDLDNMPPALDSNAGYFKSLFNHFFR